MTASVKWPSLGKKIIYRIMTVKRRNLTGCKSKKQKMLDGWLWFILVPGLKHPLLRQQGHCKCRFMDLVNAWSMSSMSTCLSPKYNRPNPPVSIVFSLPLLVKTWGGCLQQEGRGLYPYVTSPRAQAFRSSLQKT